MNINYEKQNILGKKKNENLKHYFGQYKTTLSSDNDS